MARKIEQKPSTLDWTAAGEVDLSNGSKAVKWFNVVTGETATLRPGLHPMDNQNAVVAVSAPAVIDDNDYDDADPSPETATERVLSLLQQSEGAGRADLHVYKLNNGKEAFCATYKPADFEAEDQYALLQRNWGAGTYIIRLYAQMGSTKYCRRGQSTIEVMAPVSKPGGSVNDAAQAKILETLDALSRRIDDVRSAAQIDPQAQMMQTLAMMKAMREAFGPASAPSPVQQMSEMMAMIDGAKKLRSMIDVPDEPSDPLMSLAPKVLEIISAGQRSASAPVSNAPRVEVPPMISGARNVPPTDPETEKAMQMQSLAIAWIRQQIDAKTPAREVAESIYENAPQDVLDAIVSRNWRAYLYQIDSSLQARDSEIAQIAFEVGKIWDEENPSIPAQSPAPAPSSDPLAK